MIQVTFAVHMHTDAHFFEHPHALIRDSRHTLSYYTHAIYIHTYAHGRPQEFSQGGASPKKAPLKTKKASPKKKIEIGVMTPRKF